MMKNPDFHEPWTCSRSRADPEIQTIIDRLGDTPESHALRESGAQGRDWLLWGERVWPAGEVTSLVSGQTSRISGRGIVAIVPGGPGAEAVARRICSCMNFCQGRYFPPGETKPSDEDENHPHP